VVDWPTVKASSRPSAAFGYDTGAWVPARTPPSWLGAVKSSRVVIRPGHVLPLVVFAVATAVWVAVVGYGALRLDAAWGVLAALLGLGGLTLVVRGFPLPAVPALLASVACWAFVARSWVPDSAGDVAGLAKLVGGNLVFAGPLVLAYLAAVWADGRRADRATVSAGLGGRRWFGVNVGDPEPQLPALEQVPSARFFALPAGACSHLVVAGRRAALVGTTVWPRGEFGVSGNEVVRNGRPFAPGTDEVDGAVDDLRTWARRLAPVGATCRAFLTVHPASGRLTDAVHVTMPLVEGVQVIVADDFVETVGAFLAADANTISVDVMTELSDLYAEPAAEHDDPGRPPRPER
jgi:hypothetical protein